MALQADISESKTYYNFLSKLETECAVILTQGQTFSSYFNQEIMLEIIFRENQLFQVLPT